MNYKRKYPSTVDGLRAFVEDHPDADLHGFYDCGGTTWDGRTYRCVILATSTRKNGQRVSGGAEFESTTPGGLRAKMKRAGFLPAAGSAVQRLCESSGRARSLR